MISSTRQNAEQKPCLTCRVPDQNNGSCCLDETNCEDIAKWERNHSAEQRIADVIKELEQTLEHSKKELYGLNAREAEWISGREAGLEEAISLLRGGVRK